MRYLQFNFHVINSEINFCEYTDVIFINKFASIDVCFPEINRKGNKHVLFQKKRE